MKNGKCYECILVTMDTFHSRCYLEVQVVKQFTTTLLIPLAFSSLKKREVERTSKPKSKQQQPNKASGKKSLRFFNQIKQLKYLSEN